MLTLQVNGESKQVDVGPETPLLWALRDNLGITSVKYTCGIAECGICTLVFITRRSSPPVIASLAIGVGIIAASTLPSSSNFNASLADVVGTMAGCRKGLRNICPRKIPDGAGGIRDAIFLPTSSAVSYTGLFAEATSE